MWRQRQTSGNGHPPADLVKAAGENVPTQRLNVPAPADGARRASPDGLEQIELDLLINGILRYYGRDLRSMPQLLTAGRIRRLVEAEKLDSITHLLAKVLHEPAWFKKLLHSVSSTVSGLFRDPTFFTALRGCLAQHTKARRFVRAWNPGCGIGDDLYSLAILLIEEGQWDQARLYATESSDAVLNAARAGIWPLGRMRGFTSNYIAAGGRRSFSEYYTAQYNFAVMRPNLRERITFAAHDIVIDEAFGTFDLIVCRDLMPRYADVPPERIFRGLHESLAVSGILALGPGEPSIVGTLQPFYVEIDRPARLYRRIK